MLDCRGIVAKERELMGILDNLKDQGRDIMDDPDKRSRIEQIAKERNISIDEAKAHFMRQNNG